MAEAATYEYGLKVRPYPYQCEGIEFGLERKRLLIGDEPGLGKTLQAIGIVNAAGAWPALVICPSSLKINWQREIERFTGRAALVLSNATKGNWPWLVKMGMCEAAIVNYESLRGYFVLNNDLRRGFRLRDVVFNPGIRLFRSVIVDESHRVKDPSARQSIFTKGLCMGKERVILLTGTPVINRPEDLMSQLSIMDRLKDFGGRSGFLTRYDARSSESLQRLSEDLRSCMIRREKSAVLKDLPEKTRMDLYVEISNAPEYRLAEEDLKEYLREYRGLSDPEIRRKMRMKALVKFMTLRSLATMGKLAQARDYIATFLATGQKLIVFCSLKAVVADLKRRFPHAVTVTGDDSSARKQAAVDSFQRNPETNLIICSIRAAGVGLTLTAASNVAFVELPWTYADCCQCEDRAHRLGQKSNVTCHYLLGKIRSNVDPEVASLAGFPMAADRPMDDTIDRRLWGIIMRKRSVANTIMASEDSVPTSEAYFDELVAAFLGSEPS